MHNRRWSGPSNNPHAVLEATWGSALRRAGIEWIRAPGMGTASGSTGKLTLAEITSAPFDSIASEVNTRSLNIGAATQKALGQVRSTMLDELNGLVLPVHELPAAEGKP